MPMRQGIRIDLLGEVDFINLEIHRSFDSSYVLPNNSLNVPLSYCDL